MADPFYVSFRPRSWKSGSDHLAETPITGLEPAYAPRIPTRILPAGGGNSITAATLSDTISSTQRILRYVCYEVIHGVRAEFADLRTAGDEVLKLATMDVEPFESGSFVIPASLRETEVSVDSRSYNSQQVLDHFVEVMQRIEDPRFPTSIGLVHAVEELGRITRREADRIEYYPTSKHQQVEIAVDRKYIEAVSRSRQERQSPKQVVDEVTGVVTAVDLVRASFNLRLPDRTTIKGSFESFIAEQMVRALNASVKVEGVVEFRNNNPRFVRAFTINFLEGS